MKDSLSRTSVYRIWHRQYKLGNIEITFEAFLKKYGQRPSKVYSLDLKKGWVLKRKFQTKKPSWKNRRNLQHGKCTTVEFYAYHNQKKNGCNLSFKEFLEIYGLRPGPAYRFYKDKGWAKKEMKPIWTFLTVDEVLRIYEEIEMVCRKGSYDYDEAVSVLFADLNLAKADKPLRCALSWIRRYLTKIMSQRPKFVPLTALGKAGAEYNQDLMGDGNE